MIIQLLFLSLLTNLINSKSLSVPYSILTNSIDLIVQIGSLNSTKYFEIDLNLPFNWASFRYYDRKGSTSVEAVGSTTISFNDNTDIKMEILKDYLIFNYNKNIFIDTFIFWYTPLFLNGFDSISFSNKFIDTNYSIIHNLYKNKKIDKLGFGIVHFNDSMGHIYFGEVTNKSITNSKKVYCNLTEFESSWGCNLLKVKLGNSTTYYTNDISYFQVNDKRILIPQIFQSALNRTFFNQYLKNNKCKMIHSMKFHSFDCDNDVVDFFPTISIFFDEENKLVIEPRDIVIRVGGKSRFLIEENYNANIWKFGYSLIHKYPTYFDYSEEKVIFYLDNPKTQFNIVYLYVFIIFIEIIGFVWLLSIKIKNK